MKSRFFALMSIMALLITLTGAAVAQDNFIFNMVRSTAAVTAGCLPNAKGRVTIHPVGPVEELHVEVSGLPPNVDFDFFVIQVPDKPFGMAWYQGDIQTDSTGAGVGNFVGRFSIETFVVALGATSAPDTFPKGPFPDATTNPATNPIQMYHLGLWFNQTSDAASAGCGSTETPFDGTHTAGVQALSTRNFAPLSGPLSRVR
ncbi:MAG TPA: hypothetical protein VEI52_09755 [Terriglobales bacterium]|nr:hypothetical protein [Terriglobales bacterium]